MTDLARLFVGTSTSLWEFIEDSSNVGFSPREETLTETLLVSLHNDAPGSIRVYKTSIGEEVVSGADLAMAVRVRDGLWISFLIQAKKLDRFTLRYQELEKGSAVIQAKKLISMAAGMGALPMYLFYNGAPLGGVGDALPLRGCTAGSLMRDKCGPPWDALTYAKSPAGCSLANANEILDILKTLPHPNVQRVLETSVPWECILCPFLDQAGGQPSVIPWQTLPPARTVPIDDPFDVPWLSSEQPTWVRNAFEDGNRQDLPTVRFFLSIDGTQG
jgi:hypothetical protein